MVGTFKILQLVARQSMYVRPDRPLVVKCTFDRWNKHINFASAKNCSYDLLKNKVRSRSKLSVTRNLLTRSHTLTLCRSNSVSPSMLPPT